MGEIISFDKPYWKGFHLPDGKQRWLYTDEKSAIRLDNKEYFNKNTTAIVIFKGYETEENSVTPISDLIYYVGVTYRIANYFGDTSGRHLRSKVYIVIGDNIYQQEPLGEAKEIKRISKELKGALSKIRQGAVNEMQSF